MILASIHLSPQRLSCLPFKRPYLVSLPASHHAWPKKRTAQKEDTAPEGEAADSSSETPGGRDTGAAAVDLGYQRGAKAC